MGVDGRNGGVPSARCRTFRGVVSSDDHPEEDSARSWLSGSAAGLQIRRVFMQMHHGDARFHVRRSSAPSAISLNGFLVASLGLSGTNR